MSRVEIPAFLWGALELASGTLEMLVDDERGILTKLKKQGVGETYDGVVAVRDVLHEAIAGATSGGEWESPKAEAAVEFLSAAMQKWRLLDAYMDGESAADLEAVDAARASERAAWVRYKAAVDGS